MGGMKLRKVLNFQNKNSLFVVLKFCLVCDGAKRGCARTCGFLTALEAWVGGGGKSGVVWAKKKPILKENRL